MEPALPGPRYFNPVTFARSLADPTDFMIETQHRYGDTFELPTIFGRVAISGDPEVARAVFAADPDTFVPFRPEVTAPFVGDTSLVLVSGARHRRDRKLLAPPFNGARMRAYGSIMARSAERAAAAWAPGEQLKMLDVMQRISLEVILQAVFGLDYQGERAREVQQAVIDFVGAMSPSFLFVSALRRKMFGLSPWARFQRRSEALDALIYDEIARRRSEGGERDDILSLMMSARYDDGAAMSDKELRDELLTLLFAGHETTAVGLAWAFYWLHRDPAELQKVLAEIDAVEPGADPDALAALPYLDAVCHESLRLHPIQPDILRSLARPFEVAGRTLPAGKTLTLSTILIHNREDLYPEPKRFRPSRFLDRKFAPFEFLPFGGGARRCIGAAFALYEMKIVLAVLLRSHRFRLVSSAEVKSLRRGFTMGPAGGIPMIYEGPRTA